MRPDLLKEGQVVVNVRLYKKDREDLKNIARLKGMTMQGYMETTIKARLKNDLKDMDEE